MGIYIPGMEMPKSEARAFTIVFSDGKAAISVEPFEWHEVIPVPDHGRLISAKRIEFELCESTMPKKYREFCRRVIRSENLVPTIIPAEYVDKESET